MKQIDKNKRTKHTEHFRFDAMEFSSETDTGLN